MSLFLVYLIYVGLSLFLVLISLYVSEVKFFSVDSMSVFECGFDSYYGSRLTFSLQFFLIAVIFLIFDVEIALVLPIPVLLKGVFEGYMAVIFFCFVFVILGGLYYEWGYGILDWAI